MNSSSRVKLLVAAFGLIFLGSIVYLVFEGRSEEAAAAEEKETLGRPAAVKGKGPLDERPRCPVCGKELPSSGECPYCLFKKRTDAGGMDDSPPPLRRGRYLAWSLMGFTAILGAAHLAIHIRARRRFLRRGGEEHQLKTKCRYCKRRVRFVAHLQGSYGSCPTCKNRIQFNPVSDTFD
jgi:hypothetical protein